MDKTLEDLSLSHFRLFCSKLLREDLLRERQSTVSALAADHDFTEITGLLVSTFTEDGALSVASCVLVRVPGRCVKRSISKQYAADSWKDHLIHVMSNVEPILDELLTKGVIEQESFDKISALPTSEEKMMELLDDHLKTVGDKDIFYNIIEKWLPRIEHQGSRFNVQLYCHYTIQGCTMKCGCSPLHAATQKMSKQIFKLE
uniref:CARD domain-containing protein n=1 Tax=Sander lucioperca TaxID=283035 RepID=A0A8D0CW41_SANLU